jgi:hypothetical protein
MKIKSQILKIIVFAFVVFSLSFIFPEVSYAAVDVAITNDKKSGEFTVPATTESGVIFENKTGQEVTVFLTASGEWSLYDSGDNFVGANGDQNFPHQADVKFSQFVPASLVAINKDRGEYEVGLQGAFSIEKDGNAIFLINDIPGAYKDNRGEIQVVWSDHSEL